MGEGGETELTDKWIKCQQSLIPDFGNPIYFNTHWCGRQSGICRDVLLKTLIVNGWLIA